MFAIIIKNKVTLNLFDFLNNFKSYVSKKKYY